MLLYCWFVVFCDSFTCCSQLIRCVQQVFYFLLHKNPQSYSCRRMLKKKRIRYKSPYIYINSVSPWINIQFYMHTSYESSTSVTSSDIYRDRLIRFDTVFCILCVCTSLPIFFSLAFFIINFL